MQNDTQLSNRPRWTRNRALLGAFLVIAVAGPLVALALLRSGPKLIVEGNLSESEVAAIEQLVAAKARPPVFESYSLDGLRKAPGALIESVTTRVLKIEKRTDVFVVVITGRHHRPKDDRCVFWRVFRETNGWSVAGGIPLSRP